MTSVSTIGVFYSLGPHFARTLRRLREAHPDARITAIVPPGFPLSDDERTSVDEIVETERAHYSPRDIGGCLRLVRRLRKSRFDLFVVMFQSAQLGVLASICGARERVCAPPHGTLTPLTAGPIGTILSECARRVVGSVVYAAVMLMVRTTRVK